MRVMKTTQGHDPSHSIYLAEKGLVGVTVEHDFKEKVTCDVY